MKYLTILFLLQLGDFYTTVRILNNGGRELNPIMNKLFTIFGRNITLFLKSILIVVASYYVYSTYKEVAFLQLMCLLYIVIVSHNLYQIKKWKY